MNPRACCWLLCWCRPRWSKAVLEVKASNQVALGLYGGLGFQQVGRRKGYYPDGSDALLLELAAH
jgi:ribosomal-protein-alanine N-acetyltransferase